MSRRVEPLPGMIGRHPSMLEVYRLVRTVAPSDLPVLIVGETGTGKELVARALHTLKYPALAPFIDLNCAALPESLAEAELFGAERGAYTGADRCRAGLLEQAHHGTLFLDEVCSMPLGVQAKLLRAIEHKEFRRVGGQQCVHSNFRVVAAISESTATLVNSGRLRRDMAYRLAGVEITLPVLRERLSDIPVLVAHFLSQNGHAQQAFAPGAIALLERHTWPGNVRELKTLVERVSLFADGNHTIGPGDVLPFLNGRSLPLLERADLERSLADASGSVRAAAKCLGIPRSTLRDRLSALGVGTLTEAP